MPSIEKLTRDAAARRFCDDHGITIDQLAKLLRAANAAHRAGVRECNTGISADPKRDAFEALASSLGFKTQWSGLYPTLIVRASGFTAFLPQL